MRPARLRVWSLPERKAISVSGFRAKSLSLVDTGQTVKQGQPLMRLDPVDLKLQAQAQQQAVDAARARKATSDEARYRGWWQQVLSLPQV